MAGKASGFRYPVGSRIPQESAMSSHVYKMVELAGSSTIGTDDAIRNAVETAARSLRHLDWFEVVETRGHLEDGRSRTGRSS